MVMESNVSRITVTMACGLPAQPTVYKPVALPTLIDDVYSEVYFSGVQSPSSVLFHAASVPDIGPGVPIAASINSYEVITVMEPRLAVNVQLMVSNSYTTNGLHDKVELVAVGATNAFTINGVAGVIPVAPEAMASDVANTTLTFDCPPVVRPWK